MDVHEAAGLLRRGEVVAFPTETVYGLGANALDAGAVRKIYALKGRPADNPCIVHVDSTGMLKAVVSSVRGEAARRLMGRFWPGPLTIIFPRSEALPRVVTAGLETVAVRMPNHPVALELIRRTGLPLAAPSANLSGRPSPTTAAHVEIDFPGVPVLDGGPCGEGVESTVVALDGRPRILRLGAVTLEHLRGVLPGIGIAEQHPDRPESPGMKHQHYAPSRPLVVFSDIERLREYARENDVVVLCKDEFAAGFDHVIALGMTDEEMARNLYGALRTDCAGCEICVLGVPKEGIGRTIMDRLERAATRIV